jgi:Holliday junction resolvasome RuvABC ATP-dependent DNA helicase subunit
MKKTKQDDSIASDINTFDKEVSIYKILFQDRATSLLKHVINKIEIDRYEQADYKLPSIMLAGKEGKELVARAFANSMCSDFEVIGGEGLGMGGDSGSLLENSENETISYVNQADKLTRYSVSQFYKYLTSNSVKFQNHFGNKELTVSTDNKLFVFGVNDSSKLSHDLFKLIDYHCYLKEYNTKEIEILIEQRLRWCSLHYEEQVPAIITRNGEGSMKRCIRLLSLSYLIIRSNGNTKITIKDVEIAIGLSKQAEISPPQVPDDIPF